MSDDVFLAVVSDTHGHAEFALRAARAIVPFAPRVVLHCGDVGGAAIPPIFAAFDTCYVTGNVDVGDERIVERAALEHGGRYFGRRGELTIEGRAIAWLHGEDSATLRDVIDSQRYDLVCSGHTHQVDERRVGKTLVLNPGALYRARRHTCAVVELRTMTVAILNCDEFAT
ncbi:MAG: YfcE family phosphodiesterase [Pirellulales bacterium]